MAKSIIAIFDVDGVVIKGQSLLLLVKYLFKKREASFFYFIEVLIWFILYKFGLRKDIVSMRMKALKIIKGRRVSDVDLMLQDFYDKDLKNFLNEKVLKILNKHVNCGHIVVLASASIKPLIGIIAKNLGIKYYTSSEIESAGGCYTGNTGTVVYGKEKLNQVRKLLEQLSLDISDIYVYSDDLSDEPLLSFAKYPNVVNPDRLLRGIALKRNWEIHDFQ